MVGCSAIGELLHLQRAPKTCCGAAGLPEVSDTVVFPGTLLFSILQSSRISHCGMKAGSADGVIEAERVQERGTRAGGRGGMVRSGQQFRCTPPRVLFSALAARLWRSCPSGVELVWASSLAGRGLLVAVGGFVGFVADVVGRIGHECP